MKLRRRRAFTVTMLSILLFFGCAAEAGGQASSLDQPSPPIELQRKTEATVRSNIVAPAAGDYQLLHTFIGTDGQFPSPLVRDAQGNLYGTASGSGGSGPGTSGSGVVFKVDTTGNFTILHTFSFSSTEGTNPSSGLVLDAQGNLYGTTYNGGDLSCYVPFDGEPGCGIVYKLDPGGNLTVLYAFTGTAGDGEGPGISGNAPGGFLVLDAQGNLYGTTVFGGNLAGCAGDGCGTVFKVDPSGNETLIYTFPDPTQGQQPQMGLVPDPQGNLYGTSVLTGDVYLDGIVFKIDPSGNKTPIYSFKGTNGGAGDGSSPNPGLAMDSEGNLYGTTVYGGTGSVCAGNCGTVFKLTPTIYGGWTESVLYSFAAEATGLTPNGGLVVDAQGNVYGTTLSGGSSSACVLNGESGCGTVFKVDANGNETVLYSFTQTPASYVYSNGYLVLDAKGNLYGTTLDGGAADRGTVYSLATVGSGVATVTVTPSASSITEAQRLTVTIAVSGGNGNPIPTGTVTLTSGTYGSAATALGNGSATIDIPAGALPVGTETLTGNYSGDNNYSMATGTSSVTVTVATPTVTVTPSASSLTTADALSVTIAVSGGGRMPTGTVTLTAGGNTYPSQLFAGNATVSIPAGALPVGTDTLAVTYSGDGNYSAAPGSSSVTVTQFVTPTFTVGGTAVTTSPGAVTGNTSTITVTPSGGFTGSVTLTAAITSSPTGAQDPPTLSFGTTSPVTINGASAGTGTLTISTTAATSRALAQFRSGARWYNTESTGLVAFVLFFGISIRVRGRRWRGRIGLVIVVATLTGGFLACGNGSGGGGGGNPGTTPGSYVVTVTGTSGTTVATSTVALAVQ